MIDFLKNYKNILCFFAHPDDETLGAGGLLDIASELKINVNVCFSNSGIFARENNYKINKVEKKINVLQKNCINSLSIFNIHKKKISFGKFPDNKSDTVPLLDLIKWVEKSIKIVKPDLILTHHHNCTNIDHRMLHESVITATRPNTEEKYTVLTCEILSSTGYLRPTNFEPNLYIKLSKKNLNNKIKAMMKYTTEKRSYPHPRSKEVIKALSILRGSESGNKFAESFIVHKLIT